MTSVARVRTVEVSGIMFERVVKSLVVQIAMKVAMLIRRHRVVVGVVMSNLAMHLAMFEIGVMIRMMTSSMMSTVKQTAK